MQKFIPRLDKLTIPSLLKSTAAHSNLNLGKKLHTTIVHMGLQSDCYIASALINFYIKCGSLCDAVQVFDICSDRECSSGCIDLTLWNTMINGYFWFGFRSEALSLFRRLQSSAVVRPDAFSLSIVLNACWCDGSSDGLWHGKEIHGNVMRNWGGSFGSDSFLGAAMIDVYAKWGKPWDAWKVFNGLVERSVFVWNSMIKGFCQNGLWEESLNLFKIMKNVVSEVGSAAFSMVLTACLNGEAVKFGQGVHCDVIKLGLEYEPYIRTSLITFYSRIMLVEDAYQVFNESPEKGVELWNAVLSAFVYNGYFEDAMDLYSQLRLSGLRPDSFSISNVLTACGMMGLIDFGKKVHGELIKSLSQSNVPVQTALLSMYAKCGEIGNAYSVFDRFKERDMVFWGAMVMGFCDEGKIIGAVDLIREMEAKGFKPDSQIWVNLIGASGDMENIQLGSQIHGLVMKNGFIDDIFVGCALIDMYAKCGTPELACTIFSGMPHKNLVAWNCTMSSYSQNGLPDLAIDLFSQLKIHNMIFDSISVTTVLAAVSSLAGLMKGKVVHGISIRHGIMSGIHVDNALIDLYLKCGCLLYARRIFERMLYKSLATWNSMISGTGSHGYCLEALALFECMQNMGVQPDEITFLALLTACSHSGLVKQGVRLFESMTKEYKIVPQMEHYVNMVDLWGRSGQLREAYVFIQNMPILPGRSVWLCLLASCKTYGNVKLGEVAARRLLELEPEKSGNYVQLLNMYGEAGLKKQEVNLRVVMREKGLKKIPGCSWVEVKDMVHTFFSGNLSSPLSVDVINVLKGLKKNMEENSAAKMFEYNEIKN